MRLLLIISALMLLLPGVAAAGGPKRAPDGSMLVPGSTSPRVSEDSAISLSVQEPDVSKQVQVYISKSKATWVWPKSVSLGPSLGAYRGQCRAAPNPQVDFLINKYAQVHGVDPQLVRAVMRQESGFNSRAVSPKGAQGLMQLMPGTASLMGVSNPFDPEQNVMGGVGYLRRCLDRFSHNVPLAVAAYNAGPGAVDKFQGIPPFSETQLFVQNVLSSYTGNPPGSSKSKRRMASLPAKSGQAKSAQASPDPSESAKPAAPHRIRPKVVEIKPQKSAKRRGQSK
jgi:hypothetical protein